MLAEFEDKVLVGRQSSWPAGNYSALAGFLEPGESIEEAVRREIKEEAGVNCGAVRYVTSQPWPFGGSQLMIACVAEALDDQITLDTNELEDAIWVSRDDVRAVFANAPGQTLWTRRRPLRLPTPCCAAGWRKVEMTTPLRIDIVSDVVCPWCIIGYKQVEKALTLLPHPIEAEFHWHPFELNPDMPPEGEDSAEHIARKYGRTAEQGAAVRAHIKSTAEAVGFSFGDLGARRIVNTFDAHKLLHRAGSAKGWEEQTRLKLALFAAYFQRGEDVSDRTILLSVAEAAGLDRDECQGWLDDEALAPRSARRGSLLARRKYHRRPRDHL